MFSHLVHFSLCRCSSVSEKKDLDCASQDQREKVQRFMQQRGVAEEGPM